MFLYPRLEIMTTKAIQKFIWKLLNNILLFIILIIFILKDLGELCFFVLDTTIFDKLYYFHKRGSQIRWLKDKVKEYKGDCKFLIAVAHHPLFSSGDRDRANPQLAIFFGKTYIWNFQILHHRTQSCLGRRRRS